MKKSAAAVIVAMLALPILSLRAQVASSSGLTASTLEDVERIYVAQVQGGEMTKEEEERYLKNLSPELKSKLEEIKKLNKKKYFQLLRETSYLSGFYSYSTNSSGYAVGKALSLYEESAKERNEQIKKQKELEIDVELYALRFKGADNSNQQKIKSDLQAALTQLFDIRESQKQEEVKQLEKRIEELKESLKARRQNKNEIVQRRIQELLGDSKYLRWE
jgi:polyhydroxyalkanoate synthesis regulator phasin